jgi:hypothetical protein
MQKQPKLKKYAELFRRNIRRFLAPGVEVRTTIYPVEQEGAVFEFLLNKVGDSTETVGSARPSVGAVLSAIPQNLIVGQIEGVRFGGTNLTLEGNRILVIKGEDSAEHWTGNAVLSDVQRVVSTSLGSRSL